MKNKGMNPDNPDNRGNMASYFSGSGYRRSSRDGHGRTKDQYGLLMIPTKQDPRYLDKGSDGKYTVKVWDKKSKID